MQLFIIKSGNKYLRQLENGFTACEMNKASVFPLEQRTKAEDIVTQSRQAGFMDATLYKLTITEEKA